MRSDSANNSLQTCRWRICRFELSSTLTGADSGRARRGASVTENNVTWPFDVTWPQLEPNVNSGADCFGEHLTPGCPRRSSLITHLHSESCFSFLLSFHPSLAPLFPLPSARSRLPNSWGLAEVVYPRRSAREGAAMGRVEIGSNPAAAGSPQRRGI